MTFWQFASEHPVLAVIFAVIGLLAVETIASNISHALRK